MARDESCRKGYEPVRMCVFCKGRYPKGKLVRFVAVNGNIKRDDKAGYPGRGAYCCTGRRCLEKAKADKRGVLKRALKIKK